MRLQRQNVVLEPKDGSSDDSEDDFLEFFDRYNTFKTGFEFVMDDEEKLDTSDV